MKVGDAMLALKAMAVACAVLTGLFTSEVLSKFAKPTAVLSSVTKVLSPLKYWEDSSSVR